MRAVDSVSLRQPSPLIGRTHPLSVFGSYLLALSNEEGRGERQMSPESRSEVASCRRKKRYALVTEVDTDLSAFSNI